jgi:hypothetical protein
MMSTIARFPRDPFARFILTLLWFCALSSTGLALPTDRAFAQASPLNEQHLRNATYPSDFTADGFAPLKDGVFTGPGLLPPGETGGANPPVASVRFSRVVITPDYALVALLSSRGGSGTAHSIQVAKMDNGDVVVGSQYVLGWDVQYDVSMVGQRAVVDALVHRKGDHKLEPTWPMRAEFLVAGTELVLSSMTADPPDYGISGTLFPRFPRPLRFDDKVTPRPPRTGLAGLVRKAEPSYSGLILTALSVVAIARTITRRTQH